VEQALNKLHFTPTFQSFFYSVTGPA